MITKFNKFINEAFEDVYPNKGFKLLATEDEEYVVFSNGRMDGAFLIPTDKVGDIIEAGDIGMIQIRSASRQSYTLKKLNDGKVYHTDLEWDVLKNHNPDDHYRFWVLLEDWDKWKKDPKSTNTQEDPESYMKKQAGFFKDSYSDGLDINSFTKISGEYKYKEVEFQKGIIKVQKLNF